MWTLTAKKRWAKALMPHTRKVPECSAEWRLSLKMSQFGVIWSYKFAPDVMTRLLIFLLSFGGGGCTISGTAGREGASAASRGQEERQEASSVQTYKGQL